MPSLRDKAYDGVLCLLHQPAGPPCLVISLAFSLNVHICLVRAITSLVRAHCDATLMLMSTVKDMLIVTTLYTNTMHVLQSDVTKRKCIVTSQKYSST